MAIKIDSTTVIDDSRNLTNINSLAEATWEAGVSTTETVVSPAKVKAAIDALADVGAGTAALSAGGLGSYVFAEGPDTNFGSTASGTALQATSAIWKITSISGTGNFAQSSALSGTWRCMGQSDAQVTLQGSDPFRAMYGATLWLRIS